MSGGGGGDNDIKDTPEQKYLAKVAAEKWNYAQRKLAPLEDEYMKHVDQMDSEGNMSYIRGRTMQAQNRAMSNTQSKMAEGLAGAGVNPNSGRFLGETSGLTGDLAQSGGEMLGRAQFEQDSQKVRGLQNIVAIGQGQSGQAQAGLSRLAQESSADAISNAQNAFNRRSANLQLVGQVAGAGAGYGMENGWLGGSQADQYGAPTNFNASPNQYGIDVGASGSDGNVNNWSGGNYGWP